MIPWNTIYASIIQPMQEMPHQMSSDSGSNNLVLLFLIIVSFLSILTIFAVLYLYRYVKAQQRQELEIGHQVGERNKRIISDLSEKQTSHHHSQWEILSLEEQAILNLLVLNKGNLLQKEIPNLTDFSKSTVSRIMYRLEEQDIVYRSPAGRGYRIFLKESETL
jgi:uncharacterized membrane protein